ncbi:MAG: copper resistance protein CopC [Acidimicrobiales bacterium]
MVVVAVAALVALAPARAFAHGDLIASSPFAGQTVGGDLSVIELVLSEDVQVRDVVLVGPDGDVPITVRQPAAYVVLIDLDAGPTEGPYRLDYTLTSLVDSDNTAGFLAFRYEAGAAPALPVVGTTVVLVDTDRRQSVVALVAVVVLVAGAGLVLAKWRRLRRLEAP